MPSGIRSVAWPAAPSQTHVWPDSPGSHHGWRWSEAEMPSKPARSAATACSSSASGGKCSCEAPKKYRVVVIHRGYPRPRGGSRPLVASGHEPLRRCQSCHRGDRQGIPDDLRRRPARRDRTRRPGDARLERPDLSRGPCEAGPPRGRAARRAARAARRHHRPRDGQAGRAGAGRARLLRRHLRVLRRQRAEAAGRRADRAARGRGLGARSAAAPTASCSGSCRGTSPTTRWRASRARTWRSATRSCSSTRPSARSRPRRCRRSTTRPASLRARTTTSARRTSRSSG